MRYFSVSFIGECLLELLASLSDVTVLPNCQLREFDFDLLTLRVSTIRSVLILRDCDIHINLSCVLPPLVFTLLILVVGTPSEVVGAPTAPMG